MKKLTKLVALLLALVMVLALFAGCTKPAEDKTPAPEENTPAQEEQQQPEETPEETPEEQPAEPKNNKLVYATSAFGQKFSPFFATTAYDQEVVDLTQGGLLAVLSASA